MVSDCLFLRLETKSVILIFSRSLETDAAAAFVSSAADIAAAAAAFAADASLAFWLNASTDSVVAATVEPADVDPGRPSDVDLVVPADVDPVGAADVDLVVSVDVDPVGVIGEVLEPVKKGEVAALEVIIGEKLNHWCQKCPTSLSVDRG